MAVLRGAGAWQTKLMMMAAQDRLSRRLIDTLYIDAMVLADEARGYFDVGGREDRDQLPPLLRVGFSCESLRVTARLMHIIAWLMVHRGVVAGEISEQEAAAPERRLGRAQLSDPSIVEMLPEAARDIIASTDELYARVMRLDGGMDRMIPPPSPAHGLMRRLEQAF
jgi:regulator of CtrA degradation